MKITKKFDEYKTDFQTNTYYSIIEDEDGEKYIKFIGCTFLNDDYNNYSTIRLFNNVIVKLTDILKYDIYYNIHNLFNNDLIDFEDLNNVSPESLYKAANIFVKGEEYSNGSKYLSFCFINIDTPIGDYYCDYELGD